MPLAADNKRIFEQKLNTSNEKGLSYNGLGQLLREYNRLWILGTIEALKMVEDHVLFGNTLLAEPEPASM